MKRLIFILALISILTSCFKEQGTDFVKMRTPDSGTIISQKGAYLYISATKDTAVSIEPNDAVIKGFFTAIDTGEFIIQYGHCWSATNPQPTLSDKYSQKIDPVSDDGFASVLSELKILTKYYVRSYVVTQNNIGYNRRVLEFVTTSDTNVWVYKRNAFIGYAGRSNAVAFTLKGFGYFGTGHSGDNVLKDFWKYDPDEEIFTQVEDLPGARMNAVSFVISDKAYVGTGEDDANRKKNDLYRYDADLNKWVKLRDFAGGTVTKAVAFALDGKGYICAGQYTGDPATDLWIYDPAKESELQTNAWLNLTPQQPFPGGPRQSAVAFVIGKRAYVGTGEDAYGNYKNDFYMFDVSSGEGAWRTGGLPPFPGVARAHAVGFTVEDEGYVGTGQATNKDGVLLNDFWKYDAYKRQWERKADYNGTARKNAVGVGIRYRGYIASGIDFNGQRQNDLREYLTDSVRMIVTIHDY